MGQPVMAASRPPGRLSCKPACQLNCPLLVVSAMFPDYAPRGPGRWRKVPHSSLVANGLLGAGFLVPLLEFLSFVKQNPALTGRACGVL